MCCPRSTPWLTDRASTALLSLPQSGAGKGQRPVQGVCYAPGQHRLPIVCKRQQVDSKLLPKPSACHPALAVTIVWATGALCPRKAQSLCLARPPITPVMWFTFKIYGDSGSSTLVWESHLLLGASVSPSGKGGDSCHALSLLMMRVWHLGGSASKSVRLGQALSLSAEFQPPLLLYSPTPPLQAVSPSAMEK